MTSNIGAEHLMGLAEDADVSSVRELVLDTIKASFRPEFYNRIDDVLIFERLKRKDMDQIVGVQVGRLQKLLDERNIVLALDETAAKWLAEHGFDPAYGARPLKRAIQKYLQDPLAEEILMGHILDGSTVDVTAGGSRLLISRRGDRPTNEKVLLN
jgi:ATP-dependent Clp protease ATP-binding subunit ClpB